MGLLNPNLFNNPQMGLAMGLLNAGGPQPFPVSLGQGLSQGFTRGQQTQGVSDAHNRSLLQNDLIEAQTRAAKLKAEQDARTKEMQAKMAALIQQNPGMTPQEIVRASMGMGATPTAPMLNLLTPPERFNTISDENGVIRQQSSTSGKISQTGSRQTPQWKPVADANSPTGFTYTDLNSGATGGPAPAQSGLELSLDNGKFSLLQGPMAGAGGGRGNTNTTGTTTAMQKDLSQEQAMLADVNRAVASAQPSLQQVGKRWDALKAKIKDKLGTATTQEKQTIEEFVRHRANVTKVFTQVLSDLSGAAVTESEAKRAKSFLPNVGTGLFDGDGPTELATKLQNMQTFVRLAVARKQWSATKGVTSLTELGKTQLSQMPGIMAEEYDAHIAQLVQAGIDPEQAKIQTIQYIEKLFGVR